MINLIYFFLPFWPWLLEATSDPWCCICDFTRMVYRHFYGTLRSVEQALRQVVGSGLGIWIQPWPAPVFTWHLRPAASLLSNCLGHGSWKCCYSLLFLKNPNRYKSTLVWLWQPLSERRKRRVQGSRGMVLAVRGSAPALIRGRELGTVSLRTFRGYF